MGIYRSLIIFLLLFPGIVFAKTVEQKVCISATKIRVRPACLTGEKPYSLDFLNNLSAYNSTRCPEGPRGDTGSKGLDGVAGSAGLEAVGPSTVVPSGEVIFGAVQESHEACTLVNNGGFTEAAFMTITASIGAILPTDSFLEVAFANTSGVYNGQKCKGTLANPLLTPGTICVFITHTSPLPYTDRFGFTQESVYVYPGSNPVGLSRRTSFSLSFASDVRDFRGSTLPKLGQFSAIWMYKAP